MMNSVMRWCPVFLIFVLALSAGVAAAKRAAPKSVPPVTHDGITYSVPNDNGRLGYLVASDAKSGKRLSDIKVFETNIDPQLEEDVQWIFITELSVEGNSLLVKDEKDRCYRVDLATKHVEKASCRQE
jgi:hypothetical protein